MLAVLSKCLVMEPSCFTVSTYSRYVWRLAVGETADIAEVTTSYSGSSGLFLYTGVCLFR